MLLKLAAVGTLGYIAYRYYEHSKPAAPIALAGGPLSKHATLQSDPDQPPPAELYNTQRTMDSSAD